MVKKKSKTKRVRTSKYYKGMCYGGSVRYSCLYNGTT